MRCFLLFVGYPRSGHSLIGALIDAHPDAVVAHERDALAQIQRGVGGLALIADLLASSRAQAAAGRGQGGGARGYSFSYAVPGQWQGRSRGAPAVVGDKKGGGTTNLLAADPTLLDRLRRAVGAPVRAIHGIRDPRDNAATIARRDPVSAGLSAAIRRYEDLLAKVSRIRSELFSPTDWLDVHHEDLVASPGGSLDRIAEFLELEAEPSWRDACAGVVYPAANRSREAVAWGAADEAAIAGLCGRYGWLGRYGDVGR